MIITRETMFGKPVVLVCDGQCSKAFGTDLRPKIHWSRDPDDVTWLADYEILFDAPADTGRTEGGEGKPPKPPKRHGKWCARACERCETHADLFPGQPVDERMFKTRDWSERLDNIQRRRTDAPPTHADTYEIRRWCLAHGQRDVVSFVSGLRMFLTDEHVLRVLRLVDGTCLRCFDGPKDCDCRKDE